MIAGRSVLAVMAGVLLFADAQESGGPEIVSPPKSEIILQSGQNYTLFCRSPRPIQFKQQEIPEENNENFQLVYRNGTSKNKSEYWVALDLFNVDRYAVGYYACFDDTINSSDMLRFIFEELENKTKHVAYTYVYVNGSSLVAPLNTIVVTKGDSKFLVECKPTSPDITVKLSLSQSNNKTQGYTIKYNPKIGFILSYISQHANRSPKGYQCVLQRGNENATFHILSILATQEPTPTIDGGDNNFLEGETFTINCTVAKPKMVPVDLQWTIPDTADEEKIDFLTNSHDKLDSNSILYRAIIVSNASREEAGVYICKRNNDDKTSSSFEKTYLEKPVLVVSKRPDDGREAPSGRKYASLVSYIEAYPAPTVTVIRDNVIIRADKKYRIKHDKTSFMLKIMNLSAEDTGQYMFNFSNGYLNKSLVFTLEVKVAPQIYCGSNTEKKYVKGTRASLQCDIIGFPLPDVQWEFTDEDGVNISLAKGGPVDVENSAVAKYKLVSKILIPVTVSGNITCIARNKEGEKAAVQRFLVYEMDGGFGIKDADKMWYAEGDAVVLKCVASIYDFDSVTWIDENYNEMPMVKKTEDRFSLIAHLKMDPISVGQAGLYYCMGTRIDGSPEIHNVTVTVARTQPPKFVGPEEESRTVNLFEKVNISCIADSVPPPTIQWYKDDSLLLFTNEIQNETKQLNLTAVNSTITIYPMQSSYGGVYECRVTSKDNEERKIYNLIVNDQSSGNKKIYISVASVIFFLLIVLVVYLAWKIKKEKKFRKELAAAGLLYFKEGVTKSINPDLGIDEQAELLPYDDRFEFPAERLKLGKQLGAGAFGVVYKAEARGIINAEETTTVAVKMVKKTADNMYIKALASELKIMVHLGKHINIVNLLGACTKKVGKRELIVIVEYCKFGNIHNYLQKHREVFIDQLNDSTEKSLGKVNRGFSCSSGNSALTSDYFGSNHTQETDNTFLNTANTNRSGRKDNQTPKETQTKQVELAKVSESGYVQPEWRSNYESDYSFDGRNPRPLCSRDLLAWSFQIARGMEYLASRKILHGDLAARNILLAEDNVVKICDFGLARSIYKNDEYQKKENSPLPVKWLAIECMTDRIFTTQSDVWSFGIVLWEIFSLAKTPYPNISPPSLLQWLAEGHRLEKPAHADDKLYDLMKRCWYQKPTTRPTFTQLQEILGNFLEDNVRNHYVDLNATYMDMNVKQAGEEDYLAMVTAPDYNNLVTPSPHHYVNEAKSFFPSTPTQLQHDDEGYLQMSPASRQTLFNTRAQGTKFDFDARKLTPRVSEANSYGSESTPMLTLNNLPRSGSESDHEGNSSPYMNMCTKIVEETDDDVFGTKENNAKNIQPVAVSNPTYITLSIDDEKKPTNFASSYMNVTVPNGLVK